MGSGRGGPPQGSCKRGGFEGRGLEGSGGGTCKPPLQSKLGHTEFGRTEFGQTDFGPVKVQLFVKFFVFGRLFSFFLCVELSWVVLLLTRWGGRWREEGGGCQGLQWCVPEGWGPKPRGRNRIWPNLIPNLANFVRPNLARPHLVIFFFGGVGARRGGGPKGWGPEPRKSGGPKGGGPKISRFFFSLSPAGNFVLFSLSVGSYRGILVVF